MIKPKAKPKKAPTQSTGILCWVCKDADEVLRVVQKFKTMGDCAQLLAANQERHQLLNSFFGGLPNQTMAYRIVQAGDGKIVVHSADLMYVTECATWNDILVFPTTALYGSNREDAHLIDRLMRVKQFEKSPERNTKALCPLCLEAFDGNNEARMHLFQQCLTQLAAVTEAPVLF